MHVVADNNPQSIFDKHFAIKCPYCQAKSNISAVSIPRYELLHRFKPKNIGIVYRCDSCNEPIFMRYQVVNYPNPNNPVPISDNYTEIERPTESYEFKYLPDEVRADFGEALTCYAGSCFNAFAAMCRRCLQSTSKVLGADGASKIEAQMKELLRLEIVDDDTYEQLHQIMLAGHDGAHPNLPNLSPERAAVVLELMKDVLYQLFVRQAKIKESTELRRQAIQAAKNDKPR